MSRSCRLRPEPGRGCRGPEISRTLSLPKTASRTQARLFACAVAVAAPASAQTVIDVTGARFEGRLSSPVLDFGRPVGLEPVRAKAAPQDPQPGGPADIEAMVQTVAQHYLGHPALRSTDLSSRQWLALFRGNIAVESAFNPRAISSAGAIGLGQLMPATARRLGVDPNDPVQNLHGSARYLLTQLQRFGTPELALAAYNAGPGAVTRHNGIPPYRETQNHVRRVMAIYHRTLGDPQ